jgi:Flp pilus assembly protein TadD
MGLGNTSYGLKEFGAAEIAYRRAGEIRPDAPEPWNNLAYAVAQQGRAYEAIEFAERAVAKAGDKAEQFRDTVVEIRLMDRTQRTRR